MPAIRRSGRSIPFMVDAYWNVGRRIVEEEQKGRKKAHYGQKLLENLSEKLTMDFGKGLTPVIYGICANFT